MTGEGVRDMSIPANWADRRHVGRGAYPGDLRPGSEQVRHGVADLERQRRIDELTARSSEVLAADDKQDEVLLKEVPPGGVIVVPNVLSTARILDLISDEMWPQIGLVIRRVLAQTDAERPESE